MKKVLEVAIGLLLYQGQLLVGWRNEDQHQGGKSEFPGGKVDAGETTEQACLREIQEEVGISLNRLRLYQHVEHEYDDLIVKLSFYEANVTDDQAAQIHAPWRWVARTALSQLNFPSANRAIVQRLNWQNQIKILNRLDDQTLSAATATSLSYLRLDEALYPQAVEYLHRVFEQRPEYLSQLILNQTLYEQLPSEVQQGVFAIHLNQAQLLQTKQLKHTDKNYIAACHDQSAVVQAQNIGCHAILISPVLATLTHPDAIPLGWEGFNALAEQFDGLSYALGGQTPHTLAIAQKYGAYGVAGIRAFS